MTCIGGHASVSPIEPGHARDLESPDEGPRKAPRRAHCPRIPAPLPLPAHVGDGGSLPEYASAHAAGADLRASEPLEIAPGGRAAVPTGVRLQIPPGHVGLVWPRSGLAVRHGIDTLAGVIDSDYRGEVRVVLVNHGDEPFRIARGDRVAQLLVQRVERAAFTAVAVGRRDRPRGGRLRLDRPLRAQGRTRIAEVVRHRPHAAGRSGG